MDWHVVLDIAALSLGMLIGSLGALIGVWLWFDYQIDPASSLLASFSSQLAAVLPATTHRFISQQTQFMGLPLSGSTTAYWYMSRAGGITAYLLVWGSVVWGLLLSSRITGKLFSRPLIYSLHEFLSILAIVFAILHAVVLLGDDYIGFTIFHLAIPFISPYEPLWTGLGILALYLSIALTGSFYIRNLIGHRVWRSIHYFTFVTYLLILTHAITAGSDSNLIINILLYWGTGFSVLFLTIYSTTMRLSKVLQGERVDHTRIRYN
jgi:predicted ferric reductase